MSCEPTFSMSMYLNKEDLYKDKSNYYEEKCRILEEALKDILKHQELIGGSLSSLSVTSVIARAALGKYN